MATTTRTKPSCFFELFLFIKSLSGYCRPSGVLSINPAMAKLCPSLSSTFVLVISYCPDGPFLLLSFNNSSTVPEQPAESDSPALPAPEGQRLTQKCHCKYAVVLAVGLCTTFALCSDSRFELLN